MTDGSEVADSLSTELSGSFKRIVRCVVIASIALTAACSTPARLPDPLEAGWKGASVCKALHDRAQHRILECTFPPGVGHERHYHDRHFGYAIAGGRMHITDTDGTREVDVPTGSRFASGGIEWHEVVNVGDSIAIFLIVEPK